jgi:hypothetical protein
MKIIVLYTVIPILILGRSKNEDQTQTNIPRPEIPVALTILKLCIVWSCRREVAPVGCFILGPCG